MTGPKKILFVVTGLGIGGAEWQVFALAHRFQTLGANVSVVTLIEPGPLKEEFARAQIPVRSLGMKRGVPGPGALLRLANIVRDEKPEVVHAHMFHANILARVSRLLWRRIPLVCTIHSVNESKGNMGDSDEKTWRDDAYRWTNFLASRTTAICDTAVQRYMKVGAFRPNEVETLVNGIVVGKFARNAEEGARLRKELGLENKTVGLMVSRMEAPKDHALLLRAWAAALAKNPELHLVFVGDGPMRKELEALATELKITENVSFTGVRKDVCTFMSMADFFLLITGMEGSPLVILEAAAASLPIIASNVGGIPEAVKDGKNGFLVRPGEVAHLTETICTMASLQPAGRAAMGEAGRAMIAARFDLDVVIDGWRKLYLEAMSKP